jgi:hypothetical protein
MMEGCELDSSRQGDGLVAGCYEHSNESSDSIKCYELLEWLGSCWLLKDLAPGVS